MGPGQWTHNASPKHLQAAVDGSLQRLRLDRIDVYQLHVPDPAVSFDASMETLARLREQGKIRHVALSNVTLEHVERARRIVPIVSVQNRYSFADREWDFLLDHCEAKGIVFMPWAPLQGQNREAHAALEEAARELNATPLQVALAWLLRRSPVISPIPWTSSPIHVQENIAAAGLKLPDDGIREGSPRSLLSRPACAGDRADSLVAGLCSIRRQGPFAAWRWLRCAAPPERQPGAFVGQLNALVGKNLEVRRNSALVAKQGEIGAARGSVHRALLHSRFLFQHAERRELVLNIAKCREHLLAIERAVALVLAGRPRNPPAPCGGPRQKGVGWRMDLHSTRRWRS